MGETIAVTARIPMEDKEKLDRLAMATGLTKGFLISRAIGKHRGGSGIHP